jgi:hypothetical protein
MTTNELRATDRGRVLARPCKHNTVGGMTIREEMALRITAGMLGHGLNVPFAVRSGVTAADLLLQELEATKFPTKEST